jgi:hypothetical protein
MAEQIIFRLFFPFLKKIYKQTANSGRLHHVAGSLALPVTAAEADSFFCVESHFASRLFVSDFYLA